MVLASREVRLKSSIAPRRGPPQLVRMADISLYRPIKSPTREWKPFAIPAKVSWNHLSYAGPANVPLTQLLASPDSRSSAFERLPIEILVEIFKQADPVGQIALALTSRYLLKVSNLIPAKASLMAVETADPRLMERLLKTVRPMRKLGHPDRTWIACLDCFRWRPRRQAYWWEKARMLPFHRAWADVEMYWERTVEEHWRDKVLQWSTNLSLRCPECWYLGCIDRAMCCLELGRWDRVHLLEPMDLATTD